MKKTWEIRAAGRDSLEIRLYELIGEDLFGGGTSAKSFAQDLQDAGHITDITLRVNSPGGNVFDGIAIYNTLLSHPAYIHAIVDGLAASIASVIIMAAKKIEVAENGMVMIHNPHASVFGADSAEMRKMADTMDKVKQSMVTTYRRHTDLSASEIGKLMDAETWLSAGEAVEQGFADGVLDPDEKNGPALAANFDPAIFDRFQHVPRQIAAHFTAPQQDIENESTRRRQRERLELLKRL